MWQLQKLILTEKIINNCSMSRYNILPIVLSNPVRIDKTFFLTAAGKNQSTKCWQPISTSGSKSLGLTDTSTRKQHKAGNFCGLKQGLTYKLVQIP